MSIERFGRRWGDNIVFGTGEVILDDRPVSILDLIHEQRWEELTDILAWSEACPVKDQLLHVKKRSPEDLAHRYAEVMFWRGYFIDQMEKAGSPQWADELRTIRERSLDEPVGNYDIEWVPDEHITIIYGPGSALGYALPRVFALYLDGNRTPERVSQGLSFFDEALEFTKRYRQTGLTDLVVTFAELLSRDDTLALIEEAGETREAVSVETGERIMHKYALYLRQLVGVGKLEEDNCRADYQNIFSVMQKRATNLHQAYDVLGKSGRQDNRIAEITL